MSKIAVIRLGEVDFTVRPLTIGQLSRLFSNGAQSTLAPDFPFRLLCVTLERAEPRPAKPEDIEATPEQIRQAVTHILEISGMKPASGEAPAEAPQT